MIDESALPYSEVTCEFKTEEIILLSCAGGSNCGQITNNVAVKLTQDGVSRITASRLGSGRTSRAGRSIQVVRGDQ